ncbi:MAG: hypothetical protein IH845_03450 [Nanoarchaeota archaeon]|nr:hypothetical protein [Nanoarchaeota archaeon]
MKLENIIPCQFETVLDSYVSENGSKDDPWEIRNLKRAQTKFGSWISTRIPINEIGKIVMPHYKFGGTQIVPYEGRLLIEAYENFKEEEEFFQENNPQFCKRIDFHKQTIKEKSRKKIYLSQEPLFIGESYCGLTSFKGKITHLDGFHRLFAAMDLEEECRPPYLESFIAVFNDFKYPQSN